MIVPGAANALMWGVDPLDEYAKIGHSVRFNTSDAPAFTRTFQSGGSQTTYTIHMRLKVSKTNASPPPFPFGTLQDNMNYAGVDLGCISGVADALGFFSAQSNVAIGSIRLNRLLRDVGEFVDVTITVDTTNATANDRIRFEVNGVRDNSFASSVIPAQNTALPYFNTARAHWIGGCVGYYNSYYLNGYIEKVVFVDGLALGASAFGKAHPRTGQWRPKPYTGSYGVTGFYLDFSDGSAATSGALGKDRSGNNNDWTPQNISVTTDSDYCLDTSTNCFATFNEGHRQQTQVAAITNGGIRATGVASYYTRAISTVPVSEDGTYAEFYLEANGGSFQQGFGLIGASARSNDANMLGLTADEWAYTNTANGASTGTVTNNSANALTGLTALTTGGYGMLAYKAGKLWLGINGAWLGGGDPAAGTGALYSGLTGLKLPAFACSPTAVVHFINGSRNHDGTLTYSQSAGGYFKYTPPAGFAAQTTKRQRYPSVPKASAGFVAVADSGANITASLPAASPWASWIRLYKRRESAEGWRWQFSDDTGNYLDSTSTAAKAAFPSLTGTSYIGYALNVSPAYGIATGRLVHVNGTPDTVVDGLSNARKMVILKNEATGSWFAYHPDLTAGKLLYLEQVAAETTDATISAVTAAGFTVAAALASGTYRWIALSEIPGFLRLSKYIGNGLADGAYGPSDLLPAFMLQKRIDTANGAGANWLVADSTRDGGNMMSSRLSLANTTAEQLNGWYVDGYANGYKLREASADVNAAGGSFAMLEIAAASARYANAK